MSRIQIRVADPSEHEAISRLAMRSKGHWEYPPDVLAAFRAELTYTAGQCASGEVWVGVRNQHIVGFYALEAARPDARLNSLYIDPSEIGLGYGADLLQHALDRALALGCERVLAHTDPHASSFYTHFGAARIGIETDGPVPDQPRPLMAFDLAGKSSVLAALRDREPVFHRPAHVTNEASFLRATAEDFFEIDHSGRRHSRDEVLAELGTQWAAGESDPIASGAWRITEERVRPLGADSYLFSYRLDQDGRTTRRATLWQRSGGEQWRVVYHQATMTD